MFRWGLVPFWAKDVKIGYSLINAKAEAVASTLRPWLRPPGDCSIAIEDA